jgi:hypothetical protein
MQLNTGQCRLNDKHTLKYRGAVHLSACSPCCFSITEGTVHHASQLPLRIVWCDSNIIFRSWYACLSFEEGT